MLALTVQRDNERQPLSEREEEILGLLATGATNQEIARALHISPNTVKVHLRNIYAKLGVMNRSEAILVGLQEGIVTLPGVELPAMREAVASPPPMPVGTPYLVPVLLGSFLLGLLLALALAFWPTTTRGTLASNMGDATFTDQEQPQAGLPSRRAVERWIPQTPMGTARSRLAVARWQDKVFAIGGETAEGVVGTTEVYDPARGVWAPVASKPLPVSNAQAATVGDLIYVFGGTDASGQPTDVVEAYDPVQDRWQTVGIMPHPIAGYALAVWEDQVYLFGGWDGEQYLTSVYAYNPATGEWSLLPPLETSRAFAAVAVLNGHIYLLGGYDGRVDMADVRVFDPRAYMAGHNPWGTAQAMLSPRGGATAVVVGRSLYIIGGGVMLPAEGAERYDVLTDTWARLETPYGPNWRHMGAVVLSGDILAVGGWAGTYLPITERYQASFRNFIPYGPVDESAPRR